MQRSLIQLEKYTENFNDFVCSEKKELLSSLVPRRLSYHYSSDVELGPGHGRARQYNSKRHDAICIAENQQMKEGKRQEKMQGEGKYKPNPDISFCKSDRHVPSTPFP